MTENIDPNLRYPDDESKINLQNVVLVLWTFKYFS